MTATRYPTTEFGRPDGRDYHYRFGANNENAWKALRKAKLLGRDIEMYPRDMRDSRRLLHHVTCKTYDRKGYIKGMKKYAHSPAWESVPFSHGKLEMRHGNRGGTKIKGEGARTDEFGVIHVEFHVEYTPGEIKSAFENGVNEAQVSQEIQEAKRWAVDDKIDELREEKYRYQDEECDHDHTVLDNGIGPVVGYCEDCGKEWRDADKFGSDRTDGELTVVGTVA